MHKINSLLIINKNKLILGFILVIYLLVRIPGLGFDISNSDAARWHRRSERFLDALKARDLASTYQHYQPGVTLMWVNSVVKYVAFKYQLTYTETPKTLENADYFPIIDSISRALLVIILMLILGIQVYLVSRIFNFKSALIYAFVVAIEPYLGGIDRWFHLTSLESYFAFTSFLLLLLWWKTAKNKYVIFSGLFLALSSLSKITSIGLIPLFMGLIFIKSYIPTKNYKSVVAFLFIYFAVFVLFFPAMYVNFAGVLSELFSAITNAVDNNALVSPYINNIFSPFYYLLIAFYKFSPITLAVFIWGVLNLKKIVRSNALTLLVLIYAIYYYIFMSVPDKKIDRYIIVLFLPILLFVSIWLAQQLNKIIFVTLTLGLLFITWVSYMYFPVYSAYYSPLFGGMSRALDLQLYDNSGEYYAQSAFYLNSLGRNNFTFLPYNVESFSYYYKGKLQRTFDLKTDYIVTSIDHVPEVSLICPEVHKTFGFRNASVVFIYKCYH